MMKRTKRIWLYDLIFVAVLVAAAALRLIGIDWDGDQHLHPDERFLTQVESALQPATSLAEYFDTENSPLNPDNRGFGFFVYGTFPIFLVRYVAEAVGQTGYSEVHLVGRALSALADLGVVTLVYLIANRLFDKRVGLLAAAFSAWTVMQIQQSHFWTVDNFGNFFTLLTLYFAIRVASQTKKGSRLYGIWDFIGFGLALGLALASKLSQPLTIVVLAATLPAAVGVRVLSVPSGERTAKLLSGGAYVAMAAILSLMTFRIFQPYAFLGFGLNPQWIETMKQLSAQVSGLADWPPSMQWARRPVWFGLQNIVRWGLGWPLAIVSWSGFLWAGFRILKSEWRKPYVLLWGYAAFYFVSQSMSFNPTMRYFLPVYPALAVFGAWGIVALWDYGAPQRARRPSRLQRFAKPAALILGSLAVLGAAIWSLAFVQIYRQDVSRIQAARWIYQNVPGPITVGYEHEGTQVNQPIPISYGQLITTEAPLFMQFAARTDGELTQITFKHVYAPTQIQLNSGPDGEVFLASQNQLIDLAGMRPGQLEETTVELPAGLLIDPLAQYHINLSLPAGAGRLTVESADLRNSQIPDLPGQIILAQPAEIDMGDTLTLDFAIVQGTQPDRLVLSWRAETNLHPSPVSVHLSLNTTPEMNAPLIGQDVTLTPSTNEGEVGTEQIVSLSSPMPVTSGQTIYLQLRPTVPAAITLLGSAVANETSWDDGLPLRIDGFDGFGGIYQGDLNFEMYWDEDEAKRERFLDIMDRAEYLFVTSSRQWGSLPRLPERFPLVVAYYRELIDCPEGQSIESCFVNAKVGNIDGGSSGFDLVEVFENSPRLGSWVINDKGSEEAFTVYDHPKVLIFRKNENFDIERWSEVLSAIDLTQVIRLTPGEAGSRVLPNLMLPEDRREQLRAGGTWSDLFNTNTWINASPWVSAVVWYVALAFLGIAVYPLVRWALPGLKDGGYPFARLVGLLLLSYLAWMGGSLGLIFSRGWLAALVILLAALGGLVGWLQRAELKEEWKKKRKQFLRIEVLFLAFFAIMLLIRLGNPDLWHPAKGGEKPMDFAYFNAVLKSETFPPYDPWFAGGYINYYYWGFVLVGSLVKLLGIVPSVAYNLILPSLFAMLALGAYSVAWNLWTAWREREGKGSSISPTFVGIAAALAIVLLGNLGSLQMIFQGYVRLGAEGALNADSGLILKIGWALRGFVLSISGQSLPFGLGDWYWNPTRIIPAANESSPITEFPLFTFIYADLHAHMIALPVTLLTLGWSLSAVLSRAWQSAYRWRRIPVQVIWSFALAAIAIGSLRPINTWDLPTYLAIAALAAAYALWRYGPRRKVPGEKSQPRWELVLGAPVVLAAFSLLAFQPFSQWYRQGYGSVELWKGTHTPSGAYLIHWAIFLFFIVAWFIWETRQWLASTPLSSLRKLQPYQLLIYSVALVLLAALIVLLMMDVYVAWLVLPLLVWTGLLFIRPGQDEAKRLILFLIGTGLFLTLMVEVIVLKGDISRMNTVFKFYMQAWVLISIGASAALAWTLDALHAWRPAWRGAWQTAGAGLLACAGLFLLLGVTAKMHDRMAVTAPHTLDGMEYMQYSVYYDRDKELQLSQDYEAIRWLQENVQGSPVIVEAHTGEYRWGSRISINTGLPAVIGWNWHQRQQREFVPGNDIWARVTGEYSVEAFYNSVDLDFVQDFLQRYQVKYIIVGQLERAYYPGPGLDKFEAQDGVLWREVFRVGETVIYEVMDTVLAEN